MNAKHTPTPWQAEGYRVIKQMREEPYEADLIIASTGNSTTEAIENAAFIVRACNSHQELLLACKKAESTLIEIKEFLSVLGASYLTDGALQFLSSSISKAEGRA